MLLVTLPPSHAYTGRREISQKERQKKTGVIKEFQTEDILMEDQELLVVYKRAGIAVQSARTGQMDLEHQLLNYLACKQEKTTGGRGKETDTRAKKPYLAVIHRLDQPVEGILVFAKTPEAAKRLNAAMQKGQMEKVYLAVTRQKPEKEEAVLLHYLVKDGKTNTSRVAKAGEPGAKLAELSYRVLEKTETEKGSGYLLEIRLKTGRHHQIRMQMAQAGMPLCGDGKYNPQEEKEEREQLALCAARLSFPHPKTGKKLRFEIVPRGKSFAGCTLCIL